MNSANDAAPAVPPAPPEVLLVDELATLLRMHPKTVYVALGKGHIPGATKVEGAWRIHRPTVIAWLSGQPQPEPRRRR